MAKVSQLVTPLDRLDQLPEFEGRPTLGVSMEVRGISGGLDQGLTVDPVVAHIGDRLYLLLETTVAAVNHPPVKDTNGVRRAHVLSVDSGVIVDGEFAAAHLEALAVRIEENRGIQRIPFDDELMEEHQAGKHADGLVEGCVDCQREAEAESAEAEAGAG